MATSLQDSWTLFGDALLTGLALALVLPLLGVLLVLRHQVFLAAAIGQAANFGIAVALFAGLGAEAAPGSKHSETMELLFGLLAAIGVSVSSLRALSARGSALEARAVWTFLVGGSAAMLLLADAPHGMQDVQRLMLSSLLGASPLDVWAGTAAFAVTLFAIGWRGRRVLLWAMDPPTAQVLGQNPLGYDVAVGSWIGLVFGFAIHATGLPFTFGCAILPVLLAREVVSSLRAVLWFAPLAGAVLYGVGWWCGDWLDLPPGQCAVTAMAIAVAGARVLRLLFG